jgi:hypothetical protein
MKLTKNWLTKKGEVEVAQETRGHTHASAPARLPRRIVDFVNPFSASGDCVLVVWGVLAGVLLLSAFTGCA